jgi:hypothetical protein
MFMSDEIQKNSDAAREPTFSDDSETVGGEGFVRSEDAR